MKAVTSPQRGSPLSLDYPSALRVFTREVKWTFVSNESFSFSRLSTGVRGAQEMRSRAQGSAVIDRVSALTSDLVYEWRSSAVMTWMAQTADLEKGFKFELTPRTQLIPRICNLYLSYRTEDCGVIAHKYITVD